MYSGWITGQNQRESWGCDQHEQIFSGACAIETFRTSGAYSALHVEESGLLAAAVVKLAPTAVSTRVIAICNQEILTSNKPRVQQLEIGSVSERLAED